MKRRTKITIATASTLGLAAAGTGIAFGSGAGDDGENEAPITGSALDQASAVALDHVGGGRVTGTEVGDEESYYEVEVTRDDGSQVDVQLDADFKVVGGASDDDSGPEDES